MKKGIYRRNLLIPFIKMFTDIFSIILANLFAYYLRFYSFFADILPIDMGFPPLINYIFFSLFNVIIFLILFSIFRSYRSRIFSTFSEDIPVVLKTCFLAILLSMSFAFLYRGFSYSRLVFLFILINSALFLLVSRFIFHRIKSFFLKKGYSTLRIILVGSSSNIHRIHERLKVNDIFKFDFLGYISTKKAEVNLPYLGGFNNIHSIIDEEKCEGLILTFDSQEHSYIMDILKNTEGKNIELFYVPDILDILTSNFNILEINGLPFFQFKSFSLSGWQGLLKRVFDIIVALVGIICLFPVVLMVSILIKLSSKGPVFYIQKRVSMDGREFCMYKFRSMQINAELETGPVWAKEDDPRITLIGKFLRRTSLDELPQLWNVVKGDMSLVGPRPERLHFINQFKDDIPRYLERHLLRSGMTGWAQVNGLRGQSPIEERTTYDLYYIENWSLWFDIKIIILTFIAIFKGENAY